MKNLLTRKPTHQANLEDERIALAQGDLEHGAAIKWWRYRHLFLRARELQSQQQRSGGTDQQATIDSLLAEIPDEDMAIFGRYYDERQEAAKQDATRTVGEIPPNPDELEATLITDLIREAEGRDHPQGLGFVPTADMEFEIPIPDTDPRQSQARERGKAGGNALGHGRRVAAGAFVLMMLGLIVLSMRGGSAATSAEDGPTSDIRAFQTGTTPTPIRTLGGVGDDVTVFYPASLEIVHQETAPQVYTVQASESDLGGQWEPVTEDAGSAAWLSGTFINMVFCLPPGAEATITSLVRGDMITMRPVSGAIRTYELVRVRQVGRQQIEVMDQRRAGLTLMVCGAAGNMRTIAEAIYAAAGTERAPLTIGEKGTIAGLANVLVKTIRTQSPSDADPAGYAVVEVEAQVDNLTAGTLEERDLADQLIIGGMLAERLPPDHATVASHGSRMVTYRYRVPVAGGSATWQITAPTGETVQASLTIGSAAPAEPDAAYHASIDPAALRRRAEGNRTIVLIPVTIAAQEDVTVTGDDLALWVGSRRSALTPQELLPLRLVADEVRTVVMAAQIPDVSMFEIQVGPQRWRVSLP